MCVCWGATIIYYLTSAMRLWLGFFVVWVLYLISGVVTCCKMLSKCPQEGLFSSLSVLNVNSVLRQSPPAMVRAMDALTLGSLMQGPRARWRTWLQP